MVYSNGTSVDGVKKLAIAHFDHGKLCGKIDSHQNYKLQLVRCETKSDKESDKAIQILSLHNTHKEEEAKTVPCFMFYVLCYS